MSVSESFSLTAASIKPAVALFQKSSSGKAILYYSTVLIEIRFHALVTCLPDFIIALLISATIDSIVAAICGVWRLLTITAISCVSHSFFSNKYFSTSCAYWPIHNDEILSTLNSSHSPCEIWGEPEKESSSDKYS